MKILLVGNKGQVGREIEEMGAAQKKSILGFDIDQVDIVHAKQTMNLFSAHKDVDVVINAAAYTAVDKAEDEPEKAMAINAFGVKNLAIACKKHNIPLLHISTDYVFSGESAGAYHEDAMTNPLNVYGKTKLEGELALQATWEKNIILRISWVFGKYGQNFVKTILRLAQERETLNVVNDQFGCPTPASDVARVLLELADKIINGTEKYGVYNYCGYPCTNWYDFASKIIEFGKNKYVFTLKELNPIATKDYPTKAKRPRNSELLVQKICDDYAIERHKWESYLREIINYISAG